MSETSISEESSRNDAISRRKFLTNTGKALFGASAAGVTVALSQKEARAESSSAVKEGMDEKQGYQGLLTDVFEKKTETTASKVTAHDGKKEWRGVSDGEEASVMTMPSLVIYPLLASIAMKRIKEIQFGHDHPLAALELPTERRGLGLKGLVEQVKNGKLPLFSVPPSNEDLEGFKTLINDISTKKQLSDISFSSFVMDATGIWQYKVDTDLEDTLNAESIKFTESRKQLREILDDRFRGGKFEFSKFNKIMEGEKDVASAILNPEELLIFDTYAKLNKQYLSRRFSRGAYHKEIKTILSEITSGRGITAEQRNKTIGAAHLEHGILLSFTSCQELGISYKNLHKKP